VCRITGFSGLSGSDMAIAIASPPRRPSELVLLDNPPVGQAVEVLGCGQA
jgi:hypothetical protein